MYGRKFSEYRSEECCFLGKENCYYKTMDEVMKKMNVMTVFMIGIPLVLVGV